LKPEDESGPEPRADAFAEVVDAPQALLNRLREASRMRGAVPALGGRRRTPGRGGRDRMPDGGFSGRDPEGLGQVFTRLLGERGWRSPVAVGSVLARWAELVGADVAGHCTPESFEGTAVQVRCDSTAWATQLRLLTPTLLRRFDAELGPGVVTKITVLAPAAPSWRKGSRSAGGRGPRDTYG
jgi:predicted nucleic acid-binding Zn ribbon protein